MKEELCHGIIPAIPFSAHTLNKFVFLQYIPEISAGILNASITMNH